MIVKLLEEIKNELNIYAEGGGGGALPVVDMGIVGTTYPSDCVFILNPDRAYKSGNLLTSKIEFFIDSKDNKVGEYEIKDPTQPTIILLKNCGANYGDNRHDNYYSCYDENGNLLDSSHFRTGGKLGLITSGYSPSYPFKAEAISSNILGVCALMIEMQ